MDLQVYSRLRGAITGVRAELILVISRYKTQESKQDIEIIVKFSRILQAFEEVVNCIFKLVALELRWNISFTWIGFSNPNLQPGSFF